MEVQFKLPFSDTFTMSGLKARFLLPDGSSVEVETRVTEREQAKI